MTSACGLPFDPVSVLGVINTATGEQRQWTWPSPGMMVRSLSITPDGMMVRSLSITPDGRVIEYLANPNKVISRYEGQTLDTINAVGLIASTSPAGPVASSGRTVLRWTASPSGSSAVTGNGQDIYYCVPGKASKIGVYPVNDVVLRAYHPATASTRTLATYLPGNECQLAISGQDLLIETDEDGGGLSHAFSYDLKKGKSSPFPNSSRWDQLVAW